METGTAPACVLVVEDDETLRFAVSHNLRREGYRVIEAARGDDGLAAARAERPDVIILDLMLPGLDGLQVCRLLRKNLSTPILMLTALGGESDRVVGLDTGADDYMAKPFGMRELLARVRALLRRSSTTTAAPAGVPTLLASGDLEADPLRHEIRRGGQLLALKPKEYELLLFFLQHRGQLVSREQLLERVWGDDFDGGSRTIDVHVRWLRQKIEADPSHPVRLRTIRGSGYLFEG